MRPRKNEPRRHKDTKVCLTSREPFNEGMTFFVIRISAIVVACDGVWVDASTPSAPCLHALGVRSLFRVV